MSAPAPTSLPTRQQLDEIDALLKRMLTLPSLGDEPAEQPPADPAPIGGSMTFPAPVIREVPPARPPAHDEPAVHAWRVQWTETPVPAPPTPSVTSWGTSVPLATLAEDPDAPTIAAPATFQSRPNPAPSGPTALLPLADPVPDDGARSAISPLLWPLIAVNLLFNAATHLLGPSGAWLRGSGRSVLGVVGMGMLLVAAGWAIGEWLGYDWPRPDLTGFNLSRLGL